MSSNWGTSPGKKLFGLRVIDTKGDKLSFFRAGIRCSLGYILSMSSIVGILLIKFTSKRTAFHDLIFQTYVVYGKTENSLGKNLRTESKYKHLYENNKSSS